MVRGEQENKDRLRTARKTSAEGSETLPVRVREILGADILHLPQKLFMDFLDAYIASWDFNLTEFEMRVVLRGGENEGATRIFRFAEIPPEDGRADEPGFLQFLKDPKLRRTATQEEIAFLRSLRFTTGRPTSLYYYRELQNIRDPLHVVVPPAHAQPAHVAQDPVHD